MAHQESGRKIVEIAIDVRWLHSGGIGTYAYQLISGLAEFKDTIALRGIVNRRNLDRVAPFCNRVVLAASSIYTLREQWEILWAARGADLLHVPHYNAPLLRHGPLVVSILDLIHITDPIYRRSLAAWLYARPVMNLAARRADHIVTISEFSKSQIVEHLGVDASKITAIHCGVTAEFQPMDRSRAFSAVAQAFGLSRPYILYVGNLKPHKNVSLLLHAFALLRERGDFPLDLVILGDDARWGSSRRGEASRLGITDRTHFIPSVSQDLLPKAYAAAELLVLPSTIEGFGLPVLEAMACGTPVICSRAASLPEVGGDAALYFDPSDPEDLAHAIRQVLESSDLQRTLRVKGLARARQFTWSDSTRKHVDVYLRLLGLN